VMGMEADEAHAIADNFVRSIFSWYSPHSMRWHYEDGVFLHAAYSVATRKHDDTMIERIRSTCDSVVSKDGTIADYRMEDYNLDNIRCGTLLFDLYDRFGEERYLLAAHALEKQLALQPRTLGGGFWHKKIYPHQIWLDGLYMAQPFRCRFGVYAGDDAVLADVVDQLLSIERKCRDPHTGLLYHAWDEARRQMWADRDTGCSPHFWGRAMGWYAMALVDVVELLPEGIPRSEELSAAICRLAEAACDWQDGGGLWHQVLDQGDREGNYLESSCSAMFGYFLLKAYRLGFLGERHLAAGLHAFEALVAQKTSVDAEGMIHLHDVCAVAGLGGTPYRDGSYGYYVAEPVASDDFKGIGPCILLAEAYAETKLGNLTTLV